MEEFNKFASRTKKLNEKIKLSPLREDETSKDLFGSESDSSPRSEGDSVQPVESTSLYNRVLSVVSSSSASSSSKEDNKSSKKRKAGSTLFDSFYTFFSVLHFFNYCTLSICSTLFIQIKHRRTVLTMWHRCTLLPPLP